VGEILNQDVTATLFLREESRPGRDCATSDIEFTSHSSADDRYAVAEPVQITQGLITILSTKPARYI
jgi:hypothetical protein